MGDSQTRLINSMCKLHYLISVDAISQAFFLLEVYVKIEDPTPPPPPKQGTNNN